jgi:orotidine-5'-phosphate decarboxylase
MKERLIVALDVDSIKQARRLVSILYPTVKIFKIGSQLFTKAGPESIETVHAKGAKVFLDLKFHDIPNTVEQAIKSVCQMGVLLTNIHASGGADMMKQAVKARPTKKKTILLAVTVLTSLDKQALRQTGINSMPLEHVKKLALLAKSCGMDGVVCSGQEIEAVRKACGSNFIILVPGIRTQIKHAQDQKRIITPAAAIKQGADYIVVGRPITQARDPLAEAEQIQRDILQLI